MPSQTKVARYWLLVSAIVVFFLAAYLLVEALRVPLLTDVSLLSDATFATALLGVSLLTADVLLPVPSSLVMVANGALFGFVGGSVISLVGNVAGFLLAYYLGSRSLPFVRKFVSEQELGRASRVLQRWGVPALIITRPLPILAETAVIMAGVSKLPFARSLAAAATGSLPGCLLYAWAGSQAKHFDATVIIFLALILLAAAAWAIDKHWVRD